MEWGVKGTLGALLLLWGMFSSPIVWCSELLKLDITILWNIQGDHQPRFEITDLSILDTLEDSLASSPLQSEAKNLGDWKIKVGECSVNFNLPPLYPGATRQKLILYLNKPQDAKKISIYKKNSATDFILYDEKNIKNIQIIQTKVEPSHHTEIFKGSEAIHKILFLSEGYQAEQKEQFYADVKRLTDKFLNHPLIQKIQNLFSITRGETFSRTSGIPEIQDSNSTLYHTVILSDPSGEMVVSFDQPAILEAAGKPDFWIVIVANTPSQSATTSYLQYTTIGKNISGTILIHELVGHVAIGLCDEYDPPFFTFAHPLWSPNISMVHQNKECLMNDPHHYNDFCDICKHAFESQIAK